MDDEYERRAPGADEPDWMYWLDRDEIDVMRARCAVALGDAAAAAALLTSVLERYPAGRRREAALYRSWLAEAYARAGEFDAARAVLAEMPTDTGSDRVEQRVRDVERLLV